MRSPLARFLVEAAIIVAAAAVLVAGDVGLALFIVCMVVVFVVVALLERTVLQPRPQAAPVSDGDLPVHEAGVAREAAAAADESEPEPATEWREGVRLVTPIEEERQEPAAWEKEPVPEPEAAPEPIAEREPEPVGEVEPEREPEPEVVAEPEPEPEPELVAEEEPERVAEVVPETAPEPEPVRPPVQLVEAPPPPEPVRTPAPVAARSTVVELPSRGPREWNLWDLERRARERAGEDANRDEEWAALFVNLREYASPDGMLPPEFDDLIRDSFGDLVLVGYDT